MHVILDDSDGPIVPCLPHQRPRPPNNIHPPDTLPSTFLTSVPVLLNNTHSPDTPPSLVSPSPASPFSQQHLSLRYATFLGVSLPCVPSSQQHSPPRYAAFLTNVPARFHELRFSLMSPGGTHC
ncbi:hypothetical protein BC938DRAFT_480249 [Jimgerdemannia flammicorona]|uniref:Uncharacterized protein n=1 Tax=Jimgerdemannia flammicorona TaxID=994334 RepID=A0A433QXG7_9FUNG|nr:hypothetical protein BC938DRAFT_480249 [Jimgerdemannia flammicorona]